MGIARGAIALLLEEARQRPFSGKLATLGRQTIYADWREVSAQFTRYGIAASGALQKSGNEGLDDIALFRLMGFDHVDSLDYSDFEGATHVVDLNWDSLPGDLEGQYDTVLDSGTIEHVFHIPNALANAVRLAKVGGRIIFLSPSANHVDHGFYMFSPTLFHDYCLANGVRIEKIYVVRYSVNPKERWTAYAYDPAAWSAVSIGGLDSRPYAIFVVATRLADSTTNVIPQQGFYASGRAAYMNSRIAGGAPDDASSRRVTSPAPASDGGEGDTSIRNFVRNLLVHIPGALWLAQRLRYGISRLFRRRFKIIGRY
jgi:SAM-dependent methyltransferase